MKKIILFFLIALIVNAAEISFEKNLKIPKLLEKRVTSYWKYRADKLFEKTYSYELPYLNYLHTELWYEKFFQNSSKFSKIRVKKVGKCDKTSCILGILLIPKFSPDDPIFIYDKWIKIDKIWYHKYDDSPLPTF